MPEFEFDSKKSLLNKEKHGIDFNEGQTLWDDEHAVLLNANVCDEERYLLIGSINEKIWTTVFTKRDKKTRIISIRRSRENERSLYDSKKPKKY